MGVMDNLFRHAADQGMGQSRAPVGSHYDEIHISFLGDPDDFQEGDPDAQDLFHLERIFHGSERQHQSVPEIFSAFP